MATHVNLRIGMYAERAWLERGRLKAESPFRAMGDRVGIGGPGGGAAPGRRLRQNNSVAPQRGLRRI